MLNSDGKCILKGDRTKENCYCIIPPTEMTCQNVVVSSSELWHERLGHINYKDLHKISKFKLVRDLPKIPDKTGLVCRPCQIGK